MIYGIDVNALTRENRTGVEKYVFEVVKEMMEIPLKNGERVFLYSSEKVDSIGELPKGWCWKILTLPILSKGWTHLRLSWELMKSPPDVFFSPAHEIPLGIRKAKIVNTIHDIAFVHVPEVYTPLNCLRQKWAVNRAIQKTDHIITVSQTTMNDLENYYSVDVEKMTVARLGIISEDFKVEKEEMIKVLAKYKLNFQNYLITIGRVEKKKGIGFLIKVFEEYLQQFPESKMHLVLGGKMGNGQKEIINQIEKSFVKDRIHILGFVPQDDLASLIGGSSAYVFPSTYEGFGIPALEAMASEVPVIVSDIPALSEVCGDAALIKSTECWQDWVDAIKEIQNLEIRSSLIKRGTNRLKMFNWKSTAEKTWKVLRSFDE